MIAQKAVKMEKVSFNLPSDLKERLVELKGELKVSLNTIYRDAIEHYLQEQELKRWKNGAELASRDKDYLKFSEEWSKAGLEVLEYD